MRSPCLPTSYGPSFLAAMAAAIGLSPSFTPCSPPPSHDTEPHVQVALSPHLLRPIIPRWHGSSRRPLTIRGPRSNTQGVVARLETELIACNVSLQGVCEDTERHTRPAANVGLSPPVALAATLKGVAARLEAELVACNYDSSTPFLPLSPIFSPALRLLPLPSSSPFAPSSPLALILSVAPSSPLALIFIHPHQPELASSANCLGVMLTRRQREELAWMYERAAGPMHVVLVRTALGV
ncbi:unnamed protein product [Closterium sp. NIES-64]|nr:unnamed protein product [Closterium sp. NIES-64]